MVAFRASPARHLMFTRRAWGCGWMGGEVMKVDELRWDPPGPGPWAQDRAHNPVAITGLMQELIPPGFDRGMRESFAAYGILLDTLASGNVNGFLYFQPQPFDIPGPDGPK